jgi:hypothetical protein
VKLGPLMLSVIIGADAWRSRRSNCWKGVPGGVIETISTRASKVLTVNCQMAGPGRCVLTGDGNALVSWMKGKGVTVLVPSVPAVWPV